MFKSNLNRISSANSCVLIIIYDQTNADKINNKKLPVPPAAAPIKKTRCDMAKTRPKKCTSKTKKFQPVYDVIQLDSPAAAAPVCNKHPPEYYTQMLKEKQKMAKLLLI